MNYGLNKTKYSAHDIVLNLIPPRSNILELGCCLGYLSREFSYKYCNVFGIDKEALFLKEAKKYCNKVKKIDLDKPTEYSKLPKKGFDYILLMDVLEHLNNSQELLKFIRNQIDAKKIIISIPNVANISIRTELIFGNFNYTESGLMDKTHIKFYTYKSAVDMIRSSGLKIRNVKFTADLGLIYGFGKYLRHLPRDFQLLITKLRPTLLAGQFIFVCEK